METAPAAVCSLALHAALPIYAGWVIAASVGASLVPWMVKLTSLGVPSAAVTVKVSTWVAVPPLALVARSEERRVGEAGWVWWPSAARKRLMRLVPAPLTVSWK